MYMYIFRFIMGYLYMWKIHNIMYLLSIHLVGSLSLSDGRAF